MAPYLPIPIEEMAEFLAVDQSSPSGLIWIKSKNHNAQPGCFAGNSLDAGGYHKIKFNGQTFRVARVVWALSTQMDPKEKHVDHINRNKQDNRIENLRLVTIRQNAQNMGPRHGSCPPGVYAPKRKGQRFRSQISIDGVSRYLGTYPTAKEAFAAYKGAQRVLGILPLIDIAPRGHVNA